MLNSTALVARTIERNARESIRRVAIAIKVSMSGNDPYTDWMKSTCPGPGPPTPITPGRWAAVERTAEMVAPPAELLGSAEGRTSTMAGAETLPHNPCCARGVRGGGVEIAGWRGGGEKKCGARQQGGKEGQC